MYYNLHKVAFKCIDSKNSIVTIGYVFHRMSFYECNKEINTIIKNAGKDIKCSFDNTKLQWRLENTVNYSSEVYTIKKYV